MRKGSPLRKQSPGNHAKHPGHIDDHHSALVVELAPHAGKHWDTFGYIGDQEEQLQTHSRVNMVLYLHICVYIHWSFNRTIIISWYVSYPEKWKPGLTRCLASLGFAGWSFVWNHYTIPCCMSTARQGPCDLLRTSPVVFLPVLVLLLLLLLLLLRLRLRLRLRLLLSTR